MKLLLDTHLLLWSASDDPALSKTARTLIDDAGNELWFSAASIWEIAIKNGRGKSDFWIDLGRLGKALVQNGYQELPVRAEHAAAVETLIAVHQDPFDRILISQARVEQMTFVTADSKLDGYGENIFLVPKG